MRNRFILTASFIFTASLALIACGGDETTSGSGGTGGTGGMAGTGGMTGTGGAPGTGGMTGTGGMMGTGGTGGMAASCMAPPATDKCGTCSFAQCNAEYCKCGANPECTALAACAAACMPNDQMCGQQCVQMHQAGVTDFVSVANCNSTKCSNDCPTVQFDACTTCLSDKCGTQYTACAMDTECSALVACAQKCMAGDQTCVNMCVSQHQAGAMKAIALQQCLQTNCSMACMPMMP